MVRIELGLCWLVSVHQTPHHEVIEGNGYRMPHNLNVLTDTMKVNGNLCNILLLEESPVPAE
jgi:hypothetical protein